MVCESTDKSYEVGWDITIDEFLCYSDFILYS